MWFYPPIQPRYLSSPAAAAAVYAATSSNSEHGPNNFATIRTTSIVTKQQKEHMQVRNLLQSLTNSLILHSFLMYQHL